jgi:hypothetical protein
MNAVGNNSHVNFIIIIYYYHSKRVEKRNTHHRSMLDMSKKAKEI